MGHIMRCLTLAQELRRRGAVCHFVTRAHQGHPADLIAHMGFDLSLLSAPDGPAPASPPVHAAWAGLPWEQDLAETRAVIAKADWLIVDHYAFDARWQKGLSDRVGRIMVIDDLADRPHAADVLLDQNLGREAGDYDELVPAQCRRLIGPRFALLRPEFVQARDTSLARRATPALRQILISMGGTDAGNATGQVLDVLDGLDLAGDVAVTIVMGSNAPFLDTVRQQVEKLSFNATVRTDARDMAQLMTKADLAIGAAGGTAWERCCLGLPTLMLVLAENQRPGAQALHNAGAAMLLGDTGNDVWKAQLAGFLQNGDILAALDGMSRKASLIADGRGCDRVAAEIFGADI